MSAPISNNEGLSESLPADGMAAIRERALRFVKSTAFVNPKIIKSTAASDEDVEEFGTPGSTVYGEFLIHVEWGPEKRSWFAAAPESDGGALERFINAGLDLVIVCSSTDVIRHEILYCDLD